MYGPLISNHFNLWRRCASCCCLATLETPPETVRPQPSRRQQSRTSATLAEAQETCPAAPVRLFISPQSVKVYMHLHVQLRPVHIFHVCCVYCLFSVAAFTATATPPPAPHASIILFLEEHTARTAHNCVWRHCAGTVRS